MPLPNNNRKGEPLKVAAQLRAQGLIEEALKVEKDYNQSLSSAGASLDRFVTKDREMDKLKEDAYQLSQVDDSVLIQGETGTGKELIARGLHGNRTGAFIDINCASIPSELVESTLFGYQAGAFTDAKRNTYGMLDAAEGGTLFLDEIGDFPLYLQAKLLRVMQDKKFRPVGATVEKIATCRFVAATHFNVESLVKQEKFRQDFYARISTFVLYIKPLRERLGDIPGIIEMYSSNTKPFPAESRSIEKWAKLDLSLNVRAVQRIVRRWEVLSELPKELQ